MQKTTTPIRTEDEHTLALLLRLAAAEIDGEALAVITLRYALLGRGLSDADVRARVERAKASQG
jgi:hypothetical protein